MQPKDIQALQAIIGDPERVSTKKADLEAHSIDESFHEGHEPEVVVWPESAAEISEILKFAPDHSPAVSKTFRSAGLLSSASKGVKRSRYALKRYPHQVKSNLKSQIVLILGLALAIVGYFGPWVDHKTAALVLTGQDMGEFVKFLPEVRVGTAPMIREFFYLPPFAAALCLILLMANRRLAYPLVVRAVMLLAVLGLAWAMLPPVWTPQLLITAEFRKQTVAIAFCLLLLIIHPVLRCLSPRLIAFAMMVLALLGAGPPLWQFLAIREAVNRAYGWPVQVGWGLWATVLGFLIVMAGAATLFGMDGH